MRSFLILIFGLNIISAFAVDSYRLKGGGLRMIGKSCEELRRVENGLCEWKKALGEQASAGSRCVRLGSGKYRLDTVKCVPEQVKKIHALATYKDGPNCWGTALSLKGYTSRPKFVWPEEIRYWLESPVCRKLAPGEELRSGDLITSFGPEYRHEGREELDAGAFFWDALYPGRRLSLGDSTGYTGFHWNLHTETYIDQSLAYGKDSPNKLDKFRFHPFSEMYGRPRDNNSECQELQSKTPHYRESSNTPRSIRRSKCAYFSLAYRCGDLKSFLQGLKPDSSIHREIKELEGLNERLFDSLFTKTKLSSQLVREVTAQANQASERAHEELMRLGDLQQVDKKLEALAVKQYFYAEGLLKFLEFQGK